MAVEGQVSAKVMLVLAYTCAAMSQTSDCLPSAVWVNKQCKGLLTPRGVVSADTCVVTLVVIHHITKAV